MTGSKNYLWGFKTAPITSRKICPNFEEYNMVCAYIYNILVITKHYFLDDLKSPEKVLQILAEARLKVNIEKSFFGCTETKCLGIWVSKNVGRPLL